MSLSVLIVPLNIVSVADKHDWLLFWSFNFRNIGLVPILKKYLHGHSDILTMVRFSEVQTGLPCYIHIE